MSADVKPTMKRVILYTSANCYHLTSIRWHMSDPCRGLEMQIEADTLDAALELAILNHTPDFTTDFPNISK